MTPVPAIREPPEAPEPLSGESLRKFVARRLPAYMLPAQIEVVSDLPLTRTGKIDFHALEERIAPVTHKEDSTPPRNSVEQVLYEVWREILGLKTLSVKDEFFRLGGHSLVATRLLSRIRKAFECSLTMRQFFDFPTIEQLAQIIAEDPGAVHRAE